MAHGTYFHIPSVAHARVLRSYALYNNYRARALVAICHGNPTKMLMNIINWPTRA